jgi:hypothetical protein
VEGCEKGQPSCVTGALADKISEIGQKVTPPTLLPKASLFDFHKNDFYIKTLNIIIISYIYVV